MEESTLFIFKKYTRTLPNGDIDASGIFTTNCYKEWLTTKRSLPKKPAEAFRKAITGHVRGDNGLHPFPEPIEKAVLQILRKKQIWSCFENTNIKIGLRGFQTQGFWERNHKRKFEDEKAEKEGTYGQIDQVVREAKRLRRVKKFKLQENNSSLVSCLPTLSFGNLANIEVNKQVTFTSFYESYSNLTDEEFSEILRLEPVINVSEEEITSSRVESQCYSQFQRNETILSQSLLNILAM